MLKIHHIQDNKKKAWGVIKLFVDLTLEISLGHLVRRPADGRTRHGRDNTRASTTQEPTPSELALDDRRRVDQTFSGAHLLVGSQATGLQQGLDDVQRGGDSGGEGTGQTTGDAVGERVVVLPRVHDLGQRLVGDELRRCEGDRHAQRRGIRDVKGLQAFCAVHRPGTLPDGFVNRAMNLHALLDYFLDVSLSSGWWWWWW